MKAEILTAILAFLGTAISGFSGYRLTAYRIQQLEKKVEKHNNFAERLPVLEAKVNELWEKR